MEIEKIIQYYEYFYRKFSNNYFYNHFLSKKEKKMIENFFKDLKKEGINKESLGKEFWYNYFCFQFEYWRTKITFLGKNKVMLSWVIGREAYKRWKNKSKNWKWFSENNLIVLFNINKKELILKPEVIYNYKALNTREENLKKIFKEENRLGLCFSFTTLYNKESEICKNCKEKEDCQILLKNKYVELYKERVL